MNERYYSPTLFSLLGFSNPLGVGAIIAATNFLFTWVNMMLVDRIGRRRILLCTMPFMGTFLIVAAISMLRERCERKLMADILF